MKTSWTKGLSAQEILDIESAYKASTLIRKRLVDILKEKSEGNKRNARGKVGYDNPNWAYLQADSVGYERALHDLIDLLQ
jgi:hypothetical protein